MKKSVKVKGLNVHYDKKPILWDVSFSLPQAVLVGVLGPNGAGKSTLFKAIVDLIKSSGGDILLLDQPFQEVKKKVAYVPQRCCIDWDFPITAWEVVMMGAYGRKGWLKRVGKKEKHKAFAALEKLGMLNFADRQINELSGGQQQRLFLARALMQEADIFLLDEPFAGIDLTTEKEVIQFLKLLRDEKKTIIVIHHDLNQVKEYFDWVILLNKALIGVGPTSEVFTPENIVKTFGPNTHLLNDVAQLSAEQISGVRK